MNENVPLGIGYEEGTFRVQGNTLKLERNKDCSLVAGSNYTKVSDEVKVVEYTVQLTENVLALNTWKYQKNSSMDSLYEELKNSVMQHITSGSSSNGYSYLATSDFRNIRQRYSNATPQYAYVIAFTDKNGNECVLVDLYWKIINNYNDVILHNLTTGEKINDPVTYYGNIADRRYGASKMQYWDLQSEVLEQLINAKSNGIYVSGDVLSQ